MSRKGFEEWANDFNPMMSGFLKENSAFFETYQAGMESRQPEIDALKADAERYRFLRGGAYECVIPHGNKLNGRRTAWTARLHAGDSFDAAIDAEMKEVEVTRLRNQIKGE